MSARFRSRSIQPSACFAQKKNVRRAAHLGFITIIFFLTSTSRASVFPPVMSANPGAFTIPLNGTTSLSFTIQNLNPNDVLTGIAFTDDLGPNLVVANPNGLTGLGCGGAGLTAVPGSSSVSLSGGSLGTSGSPNNSCTLSVNVTGTMAGLKNNYVQAIATESGPGNTSFFSMTVVAPPSLAQQFNPATIAVNATTLLTFTITNPAGNTVDLTGVAFTDTLPAGLTVTNSSTTVCGGTLTATGPTDINLSGATIAIASPCQFSLTVTGAVDGNYTNTTGVASTNGGIGNTASASVSVSMADISVTLTHAPDPAAFGGRLILTATVTNLGPNTATVSFTESLAGKEYVVSATPQGVCSYSGAGPVNCALGPMTSGQTIIVTVVVTPLLERNIAATATVKSDLPDPDFSNNTALNTGRIRLKPLRF